MSPEQRDILTVRVLPARLNVEEVALYLGFEPYAISILVVARLLKPLGKPRESAPKYFAACELAALREDAAWLGRCSEALSAHWRAKRARRNGGAGPKQDGV